MARRSLIQIAPGMRFGRLTVIGRAGSSPSGEARWKCRCDCGNFSQPLASSLRRGTTQSCGCYHKEITRKRFARDLAGQKFGRLTVLYRAGRSRNGSIIWRCRCDCGQEIESRAAVLGTNTKSCGCLQREQTAQRAYRHGDARSNDKKSPLYVCWCNIKTRCLKPKDRRFKNYGGRGITIAPQWVDDFRAFRDYINQNLGPKPNGCTLDRVDNDQGYFPGNLRWSTRSEQNENQRRSKINKALNALLLKCVDDL